IFWLDLLLAISNALPAYPFDGGFIFRGGVDWFLEKFMRRKSEDREKLSDSIASAVSTLSLVMFAMVIIAFVI
ncbi:MAG: metalloprotease, partial [Candidatus Methanomethylophilaceae archaeon]|nr:metalloprotease [Candidatus Methanomethylophilaceae archaeon]